MENPSGREHVLTSHRYYEGGVSSVYFWDIDEGFAGVVLVKNSNVAKRFLPNFSRLTPSAAKAQASSEGGWDSIHVFEVGSKGRMSHYKLTSTVILQLGAKSDAIGKMDLGGNLTRQVEQDMAVENEANHISNIGKMVEDMELKMRNLLRPSPSCCCSIPVTC